MRSAHQQRNGVVKSLESWRSTYVVAVPSHPADPSTVSWVAVFVIAWRRRKALLMPGRSKTDP